MSQIIEMTVYQLDELADTAKEKVRAWYSEGGFDHDWYEFVYADFERLCEIVGVCLKTRPLRLYGGGTQQEPCLYFTGFWSQGDGACFEGVYAYRKRAAREMKEYAPQDAELHRIACSLQAIQCRNFYQLRAEANHRGHYYHENCMAIEVERDSPTNQTMTAHADEIVIDALRDLARWLYRQLEREYEYQTSDAAVDEALIANGYTFTAAGRRFG